MTRELPIEQVAANFAVYLEHSIAAVSASSKIVQRCRPIDYVRFVAEDKLYLAQSSLSRDSFVHYGLAIEAAINKEMLRIIDNFCSELSTLHHDVVHSPGRTDLAYRNAPDCAWSIKINHGLYGVADALATLQNKLFDLAKAASNPRLDGASATSCFNHAKLHVSAGKIIKLFDRGLNDFARYTCQHAIELIQSLVETLEAQKVVEQHDAWSRLVQNNKHSDPYYSKFGPGYTAYQDVLKRVDALAIAPVLRHCNINPYNHALA